MHTPIKAVVHGSMTTPVLRYVQFTPSGNHIIIKRRRLETSDITQAACDFTVAGITYATSMATDLTNHKESRSSPSALSKSRMRTAS